MKGTRLYPALVVGSLLAAVSACFVASRPHPDCAAALGAATADRAVGTASCFVSDDLTTDNPLTTPPDNSLSGLPPGAFVPRTDAANVPGLGPGARHPAGGAAPGLQLSGTMRDDPQARWLLRLPADWNGRLVVGVPPGVRSEHALDATHSDYLVSKGYAYAASNKGHLASRPSGASDPAACQASPPGGPGASVYVHGYQADLPPDRAFAVWVSRTVEIARLGKHLTTAYYGSRPTRTYVSGISAGALVTRRVLETDPEEFDGGLDWAAPHAGRGSDFNGLLGVFPSGLKSLPEYRASGYSPASAGYRALQAAFFPPDIFGAATPNSPAGSYLETHYNAVWTGLECGNQRILDPGYAGDPADYDFPRRRRETGLGSQLAAIETTGSPQRPLVTIHGTMDATAPIHGSRLYRADVVAAGRAALHRLYEVQNGTHRDRYRDAPTSFAEVEYMLPHFRDAFERLVRWVEDGQEPPPGQCIPRGERLADDPAAAVRPERCLRLLE